MFMVLCFDTCGWQNVSESYLERYKETMLVTSQLLKSAEVQSLMDRKTTSQSDSSAAPNYSSSAVVGSEAPSWKVVCIILVCSIC